MKNQKLPDQTPLPQAPKKVEAPKGKTLTEGQIASAAPWGKGSKVYTGDATGRKG
jgi:hypothetical protein